MTTTAAGTDALTAYQWEPQPKAAAFVQKVVDDFLEKLPEAKAFADRLYRETGNRFVDLIDTITLPHQSDLFHEVGDAGWSYIDSDQLSIGVDAVARHSNGIFPTIKLVKGPLFEIGLKVEDTDSFAHLWRSEERQNGETYKEAYREKLVFSKDRISLRAIERHGWNGWGSDHEKGWELDNVVVDSAVANAMKHRDRVVADEDEAFRELSKLVDEWIETTGRDVACDLFFAAEREYWQRRNTAAQFQKARQDKLGIGWANHDHHTYRSSRRHFHKLVGLWEKLGFECRERFYPGPEAGWGAQVMEQPVCGIVTFNDVDISEDEMLTDFAHEPMEDRTPEQGGLGTVGLWCGLHGESVLQAGMHHLECTFDFAALEEQMKTEAGIETMPKFTDFPHLKQAFTKGERWDVDPKRIDALLEKRLITEHQAKEFRKHGAIGSHLENLERNDGFKGFNQTGVTDIIKRTDPRHAV
jgi:hypothetical protein